MKTLSSFELIRGDWVKFADDFLRGRKAEWLEYSHKEKNVIGDPEYRHYFSGTVYVYTDSKEVEAVIRPPFVLRDLLEKNINPDTFCKSYSIPIMDMITGLHFDMEFKKIHPKEEKKSLVERIKSDLPYSPYPSDTKINDVILKLATEIDKLKNKENEG